MDNNARGRRDFLMMMTAFGAAGLTGSRPRNADVSDVSATETRTAYDPAAKFDLNVSEVDFRRSRAGRMLMARIYQPIGAGPFPTVLDLHGGAWNATDRH